MLWKFLVIFAYWVHHVQCKYMGKRDSTRNYYTLYVPEEPASASKYVDLVARDLGVRVEGQVGELEHYYMVSSPNDGLSKRTDEDKIFLDFQNHKLSKRNHEGWTKIKRIDKQVPKRLIKRGPIQIHKSEIQTVLGIKDPLIDSQWHLVSRDLWCEFHTSNTPCSTDQL